MIQEMWNLLIDRHDFFCRASPGAYRDFSLCDCDSHPARRGGGNPHQRVPALREADSGCHQFSLYDTLDFHAGISNPLFRSGERNGGHRAYGICPSSMVRNTHTGIANVEPAILEAAKGMGSTRLQTLFKIKLPLAMPVIMSGIRNMATMTIALAGIASFIGAGGLGVAIYRGLRQTTLQ